MWETLNSPPLDVIARLRQDTTTAGDESVINPVQQKMLGYIRHSASLGASDLHMTPGRDNTDFTYVEARVHGELEVLDILRKEEGLELLGGHLFRHDRCYQGHTV